MANAFRSTRLGFTFALMATLLAFGAVGCGAPEEGDGTVAVESVQCPAKLQAWAVGTPYKVGDLVSFNGSVFQCRQAHTPVDGWFPNIVPALWTPVQCSNGTAAPPAAPPPPPAAPPPPPANNGNNGGVATGGGNTGGQCVGGPKFDPAGAKNVGNGRGLQFIGGQCLSTADCASGCCAKPCGICSGPGAQFQAGKQGCGFGN
jgi:hypothetical protein